MGKSKPTSNSEKPSSKERLSSYKVNLGISILGGLALLLFTIILYSAFDDDFLRSLTILFAIFIVTIWLIRKKEEKKKIVVILVLLCIVSILVGIGRFLWLDYTKKYSITLILYEGKNDTLCYSKWDNDILLPKDSVKRRGYDFKGWYDQKNEFVTKTSKDNIGNKTFKAEWKLIEYTIKFNLNGYSTNDTLYTIEKGKELPTPSKKGCLFDGWYDNEQCEGSPITSIPKDSIGERIFWGKWKKDGKPAPLLSPVIVAEGENPKILWTENEARKEAIRIAKENLFEKLTEIQRNNLNKYSDLIKIEIVDSAYINRGYIVKVKVSVRESDLNIK